jgi:(1->4)-alpha-D-glucan 1-alpha-D-glucosylmutase
MLNTSTHDSKRSEDVRARINVLTEIPGRWQERVQAWARMNRSKRSRVAGRMAPERNDEYALYQTLVGSLPPDAGQPASLAEYRERVKAAALKGVREAKTNSSWINPDPAYEQALTGFLDRILTDADGNPFLRDLRPFAARVALYGMLNGLTQTLLKLTVPGVPDIYQGNEVWRYCLVDPDNRRPVDFERRKRLLQHLQSLEGEPGELRAERIGELLQNSVDGALKLYVTWKTLQLRRQDPELFHSGAYKAVTVRGSAQEHVCAFARAGKGRCLMVIAPRLYATLFAFERDPRPWDPEVWGDTLVEAPTGLDGPLLEVFTGLEYEPGTDTGELALRDVLARFPVALLQGRCVA